ncbi:MAG: rRNA maturation RNase YbeY [Phycisphaeraceae bacterium]|nr:rRNA maturation RNase YbeY [Phycisphaeraceae bacterium]
MDVDCRIFGQDVEPPAAKWLPAKLAQAAHRLGVRKGHLSVAIVGDRRMASVHQQFSNTPGTTDVLTFDLREPGQKTLEGELILCRDQARRQARQRGHDTRTELLLYAVHGLLHLLGHDDHDPTKCRRMHALEDQVLTSLGLGKVFTAPPARNAK